MRSFRQIIKNPSWVIKRIREKYFLYPKYRAKHLSTFRRLLNDLDFDIDDFLLVSEEFNSNQELHDYINKQFARYGIVKKYPPDRFSWPVFLYFLVRKTRPEIVLETGCWYGNSSVCILAALSKNNSGRLYTIDLPAYFETGGYYDENPYLNEEKRTGSLPAGTQPGFIIPEFLKNRWELILGPSSDKLPSLLSKLGRTNIFAHDSLHTYDNMKFEFESVYPHIKDGGFLISDNIDWNSYFHDFAVNRKSYTYLAYYESPLLKENFGLIKKDESKLKKN